MLALLLAVLAGVHAPVWRAPHADTLRIVLLLPSRPSDADGMLAAGAAQGLVEARRAAALFGGSVSVRVVAHSGHGAIGAWLRELRARGERIVLSNGSAIACDALSEAADEERVLFVDVGCPAEASGSTSSYALNVHVWPSDADQREVLARVPAGARASAHVAVWDSTLDRYGADQLNQRFRNASGRAMTAEAWAGWVAVKVLWEASLRAHTVDPAALARVLMDSSTRFDGHKGRALSFRSRDHRLDQPLYAVFEQRGRRTVLDVPDVASGRTPARQPALPHEEPRLEVRP